VASPIVGAHARTTSPTSICDPNHGTAKKSSGKNGQLQTLNPKKQKMPAQEMFMNQSTKAAPFFDKFPPSIGCQVAFLLHFVSAVSNESGDP